MKGIINRPYSIYFPRVSPEFFMSFLWVFFEKDLRLILDLNIAFAIDRLTIIYDIYKFSPNRKKGLKPTE